MVNQNIFMILKKKKNDRENKIFLLVESNIFMYIYSYIPKRLAMTIHASLISASTSQWPIFHVILSR